MQSGEAINLFWWKGEPNFGDALSPLIVGALSDRPVTHCGAARCDMLALGSLLQVMAKHHGQPTDGPRPVIWGAGLLRPVPRDFVANFDIALLRGPVSAALLGVQTRRFGDPGLLAHHLIGAPERQDRVVLIPHHSMVGTPAFEQLVQSDTAFDVILPDADPLEFCRRIASSAHVISASLHGLILADCFGVASTWLAPGTQSHLKYHDYAASVGRVMVNPTLPEDIPALLRNLPDSHALTHSEGIERARQDLIETFPAQFRATTNTAGAMARA
ncbi:polysaccharide pyruvyl transferase family protein [Ruegeria sp. 2012CJ41-6]|uniref:Polysaccharide pyruvyl transferase family protein n=1 Tax=Ruegeria spongiae TaxID=2942209 RepID=A0ABT0PYZ3_9RHOB|nr:polysaccharide pyruvyl transferase family protein [Ruegeria spongiae]MCL6282148.1 polysaccharide pyruvyl transferase family protein [Ruegeria spongiae]